MLGFFIKSGDKDVSQYFSPFVWEFSEIIKQNISWNDYGQGIDVFLIEYHLEGKYMKIPDVQYKINAYRKKEKSVSIAFYVPILFHSLSEIKKKDYIIRTTNDAILLVKKKMKNNEEIKFNYDKLLFDLINCSNIYLSMINKK